MQYFGCIAAVLSISCHHSVSTTLSDVMHNSQSAQNQDLQSNW